MPMAPLLLALPLLSAIAANAASLSIGVFKPSGIKGREAGVEHEIVMGVLRWWGGALTVREEGKGVRGGCKREGREFSLSEDEVSSASLKFMGIRSGGLEVVVGGRAWEVFWGESWAAIGGVVELLLRIGVWVERFERDCAGSGSGVSSMA